MKKQCSKCKQIKSIEEFHKRQCEKDGLQWWCKTCVAIYRVAHKEKYAAYYMGYRQTPRGRVLINAALIRYWSRHPLRLQCHRQLNNAIAAGKIQRGSCINGCKEKAEGHHPNYHKPFVVIWMCKKCHTAWHYKLRNN